MPNVVTRESRAHLDRMFITFYDDLLDVAARHLRRERPEHTLDSTALLHEAYLRLARGRLALPFQPRHFRAQLCRTIRCILVDHARGKNALKRVSRRDVLTEDRPAPVTGGMRVPDMIELDRALKELGSRDARLQRVVECRFFGGLSESETAEELGVSLRTVQRDWMRAKAHLHEMLAGGSSVRPVRRPRRADPLTEASASAGELR